MITYVVIYNAYNLPNKEAVTPEIVYAGDMFMDVNYLVKLGVAAINIGRDESVEVQTWERTAKGNLPSGGAYMVERVVYGEHGKTLLLER